MARARLTVLGLAARGQAKSLLGSLVGLLLGHDGLNLLLFVLTIQFATRFT